MKIKEILLTAVKFKLLRFKKPQKLLFLLLGIFASMLLIFLILIFSKDFSSGKEIIWGVTFSKKYAQNLGLNWKKAYLEILYDLKADRIRLPVYWDELEKNEGVYDFKDYDWMLDAARLAKADIVLVLGRRQPRWPECYTPSWAGSSSDKILEEKILKLVQEEVSHFKEYENIIAWQVENEPLLSIFGECPPPDKELLKKEIEIVKSSDSRPVIVTDSGELSSWFRTSRFSDILGTTMYRVVWNKHLGYLYYPLPPAYYRYKADLLNKINSNVKKIIISELQVEPWSENKLITDLSLERQFRSMGYERMKMNLSFAKSTGFSEAYLWGVEWWYWLKVRAGHPEFWDLGKSLWQD